VSESSKRALGTSVHSLTRISHSESGHSEPGGADKRTGRPRRQHARWKVNTAAQSSSFVSSSSPTVLACIPIPLPSARPRPRPRFTRVMLLSVAFCGGRTMPPAVCSLGPIILSPSSCPEGKGSRAQAAAATPSALASKASDTLGCCRVLGGTTGLTDARILGHVLHLLHKLLDLQAL
jgi:hypothetical protein